MATLKDRTNKQKAATPTQIAVDTIIGKKNKYAVNVVFDGNLEDAIRDKAKENGIGVATYIKMLVSQDLKK